MRGSWILITLFSAACGSSPPPAPSTGPGNGTSESITGRERVGWDQPASDSAELATFGYAIYVDGVRSEIVDPSCVSGNNCFNGAGPVTQIYDAGVTTALTRKSDACDGPFDLHFVPQ